MDIGDTVKATYDDNDMLLVATYRVTSLRGDGTFGVQCVDCRVEPKAPKPEPGSFDEFCGRVDAARGTAEWVYAPGKQLAVAWVDNELQVWTGVRDGLRTVTPRSVALHALWADAKSARIDDVPGFRSACDQPSTAETVTARVGTAERNVPVQAWYNRHEGAWHDAASGRLIRVPVYGWVEPMYRRPRRVPVDEALYALHTGGKLCRGHDTLRAKAPDVYEHVTPSRKLLVYRVDAEALVRAGGWEIAR